MTSWNDGYVVDASYTEQAFPQMTPGWLSFVALLHGQPPIDLPVRSRSWSSVAEMD